MNDEKIDSSDREGTNIRRFFRAMLLLCIVGLLDALYLSVSHYRVFTDIGYRSFCAISKAINCDTVSASPYSVVLGAPMAVWGVIGYGLFLVLLLIANHPDVPRKRVWPTLFVLSLLYSLSSGILAGISAFWIHSYCLLCMLSYLVSFLLFYFIWLLRRRVDSETALLKGLKEDFILLANNRRMRVAVASFAVIVISIAYFYPAYWHLSAPTWKADISTGLTKEGFPWIGARKPELQLVEFADYLCFQCKKMHFILRELVNRYPEKIRLVHRQFPMDDAFNPLVKKPFHVGSAKMALMAEYAKHEGKFWQMNDLLYDFSGKKEIDIRELAKKMNLDYRVLAIVDRIAPLRQALQKDIIDGLKMGITGTPAFVIEGKVYQGNIPAGILNAITDS